MSMTKIIGLTGSIAAGKSTAAQTLQKAGYRFFDADKMVHELLARGGGAEEEVLKHFPESTGEGGIDRQKLFEAAFSSDLKTRELEGILHPKVFQACRAFVKQAEEEGAHAVVIEMPLLFETGFYKLCDTILCLTVSEEEQRRRAMQRPGMTEDKLQRIRSKQWPDEKKTDLADFVIDTTKGMEDTQRQLQDFLDSL